MIAPASAAMEWRRYWYLPLAAALGYSAAVLHTFGFGPFIEPLQKEFGWTRTQISAGITITGLAGAVFSVPMGLLIDRLGPRLVGLVGVLLMTASFALLGTATGSTANWLLLWGVVAFANLWMQATVWTSAVASRFEASRGLAFAITLSGGAVSATIFPLLGTWLIGSYGWRTGFMAMGGIWAAVVFPVLLLFFRGAHDRTRRGPKEQKAAASDLPGASVAEGLRSSAFYKLLLTSGFSTFTGIGFIVHFVPILTSQGADPLQAAGVASLVGVFTVIGRVTTGLLLDRLPPNLVGASVVLLPVVSCALLLFGGSNPVSQSVAAACFGFTVGAEIDIIAFLTSRYFGLKNYGVLFGAMIGALGLGIAFGPIAAGAVFDRFGSYEQFLFLTMGFMAVSSLMLATLNRPAFSASRQAHVT